MKRWGGLEGGGRYKGNLMVLLGWAEASITVLLCKFDRVPHQYSLSSSYSISGGRTQARTFSSPASIPSIFSFSFIFNQQGVGRRPEHFHPQPVSHQYSLPASYSLFNQQGVGRRQEHFIPGQYPITIFFLLHIQSARVGRRPEHFHPRPVPHQYSFLLHIQ